MMIQTGGFVGIFTDASFLQLSNCNFSKITINKDYFRSTFGSNYNRPAHARNKVGIETDCLGCTNRKFVLSKPIVD